jgi:hypothetical protein
MDPRDQDPCCAFCADEIEEEHERRRATEGRVVHVVDDDSDGEERNVASDARGPPSPARRKRERDEGPSTGRVADLAGRDEAPSSKTRRAADAPAKPRWECPICNGENEVFPMMGTCGHAVCEDCCPKITDCPECRAPGTVKK